MAGDLDFIGLTPMDHIPAKLYLPYILYFNTTESQAALHTIDNGLKKLVSLLPWLAGDVVLRDDFEGSKKRKYIAPPRIAPHDVSMLQVKHFESDEDLRTQPLQACLPMPCFIPTSQQRPVVRFQANASPHKIKLVMSFMHNVFDASGAGVILQALAECCKAPDDSADMIITQTIATEGTKLREEVLGWPSKCQTRIDHSLELGPPLFDSSISAEQWGAMESAMSSAIETQRITFSPQKVTEMKDICAKILSQLQPSAFISSNDIISAALGICVDRVLHPERANKAESASMFMVADLRSRVNPPLPDTYLGNMIYPIWNDIYCTQATDKPAEDADLLHLVQLALQLRTKLGSMDETLAYSASALVAEQKDWTQIEGKPASIIVTSWRHLKVFALDFGAGLGHIEDFECGLALVPGSCFFMPSRTPEENSGSTAPWEVTITMKPGDFETLVKDPLFSRIIA